MFYKKSIKQCAELSRAEPMLALQKIFKKHLKEYATKILIANMPGKATSSSSSSAAVGQYALTNLTKELKEVGLKDFSNPQGLIQNFFKEGDSKITPDERVFLCTCKQLVDCFLFVHHFAQYYLHNIIRALILTFYRLK